MSAPTKPGDFGHVCEHGELERKCSHCELNTLQQDFERSSLRNQELKDAIERARVSLEDGENSLYAINVLRTALGMSRKDP